MTEQHAESVVRCKAGFEHRTALLAMVCDEENGRSHGAQDAEDVAPVYVEPCRSTRSIGGHCVAEPPCRTFCRAAKQQCYTHTFVKVEKCGCPPDPTLNDGRVPPNSDQTSARNDGPEGGNDV